MDTEVLTNKLQALKIGQYVLPPISSLPNFKKKGAEGAEVAEVIPQNVVSKKKTSSKIKAETPFSYFKVVEPSGLLHAEDPDVAAMCDNFLESNLVLRTLDGGYCPFQIVVNMTPSGKLKAVATDYTSHNQPFIELYGYDAQSAKGKGRPDKYKNFSLIFDEMDEIWLGCGKDFDYYNRSYPCYTGHAAVMRKGQTIVIFSKDIRQMKLQPDEKIVKFICTVNDDIQSRGWLQTTLGYYTFSSINNRDGFLPKIFIRYGDEYRFNLLSWGNIYPFGQVKKIKTKILIPEAPH